jgi:hypothetical protein
VSLTVLEDLVCAIWSQTFRACHTSPVRSSGYLELPTPCTGGARGGYNTHLPHIFSEGLGAGRVVLATPANARTAVLDTRYSLALLALGQHCKGAWQRTAASRRPCADPLVT